LNRVTRRQLLGYGAAAAALLLVLLIAIAAFLAMQVTFRNPTPNGAVPAVNCSPAPCAAVQGYTLRVSNLKVDGDLVSMQVTFVNSSSATHASPEDLRLIDSKLHRSGVITDAVGRNCVGTTTKCLQSSWYLTNVFAGFEIWNGGHGMAVNSFNASVTR